MAVSRDMRGGATNFGVSCSCGSKNLKNESIVGFGKVRFACIAGFTWVCCSVFALWYWCQSVSGLDIQGGSGVVTG